MSVNLMDLSNNLFTSCTEIHALTFFIILSNKSFY